MAGRPVLRELDDALAVGSRAPAEAPGPEHTGGGDENAQRSEPGPQRRARRTAGSGRPRERTKSPRSESVTSSRGVPTTAGGASDVQVVGHPTPPGAERRKLVAMRLMPGIVARFDRFEEELNRHGRRITLTQLWTAAVEHALPDDPDAALELRHRWEALMRSGVENPYRGQEAADVSVRLPVELIARLDRLTRHAHRVAGYPRNGRSGLINAGLHFHGPASADEAIAWSEAYETAQPADTGAP